MSSSHSGEIEAFESRAISSTDLEGNCRLSNLRVKDGRGAAASTRGVAMMWQIAAGSQPPDRESELPCEPGHISTQCCSSAMRRSIPDLFNVGEPCARRGSERRPLPTLVVGTQPSR